ncbi:MAG: spermidine/putrescine ABC transporter substrate-binding protein [Pyrobaculum sp.]
MVTRRKLLIAVGAFAAAAALGGFLLTRGNVPQLSVYNYSYFIDKDLIKEFEKEYGIRVIYNEFEDGAEAYAALLRGGAGYDVVVVPDLYLKEVIAGGYVKKINHEKLSNIKNIDPAFFNNPNDPGLQYSIPYAYGTTGIAVNYYAAGADLPKIDSWSQLFDFDLLRRVDRKVAMLEEFSEPVMAAKYALGIDPDDWSVEAVNKVIDLLKRQKEFIKGYLGASTIVPALAAGELWISQIWSGDAISSRELFIDTFGAQHVDKFVYTFPKPSTHMWVDFMVIPKDARNIEAAYLFIDYLLRPENSARIVKAAYYPTALRREIIEKYLDPEILNDPAIFPPPDVNLRYLNYTKDMLDAVVKIRSAVLG